MTKLELEEMSFADLKDLVRACELQIPKHATAEDLVDLMVNFYAEKQAALAEKVALEDAGIVEPTPEVDTSLEVNSVIPTKVKGGKFDGYATRAEYENAMLTPVLCIITPQSPEFQRQSISTASISVGNSFIRNREFTFIADGSTVTSVPRIAVERIKEMKILVRGTMNLDKNKMQGNLQGSGFGKRFSVYELNDEEIAEYQAKKQAVAKKQAALGVGL